MKHFKTIIGVGQTGSKLASLYSGKNDILLTFNTDRRDSGGISLGQDHLIVNGGAGQNYTKGLKIWASNKEKLERYLEPVIDQDVVYFIAAGGGSGSSSVVTFLNILTKQSNRILLVVAVPYIKEYIPATSNATRLLSRVAEFSNNISVLVVGNDEISKEIGSTSFEHINSRIIEKVKMITDIIDYHDNNYYTPFAIDEGDHKSVIYSGGFINISNDNLEIDMKEKGPILPKFSYGKLSEARNVLIAKNVSRKFNQSSADIEADNLMKVSMKIGGSAKGARTLYGIIRSDNVLPTYTTIATGLTIDKIFKKLKTKATNSAIKYIEKVKTKTHKILERAEDKTLDI